MIAITVQPTPIQLLEVMNLKINLLILIEFVL